MKHEVELAPVEVVPSQIITEVVFTPAPSLNASIEYNLRVQEQRRREQIAYLKRCEEERQHQQMCDCTAYRDTFIRGRR